MSSLFSIHASWQGGLGGDGKLSTPGFTVAHSAPVALGGSGAGTNPEELLASAAASCYLITLGAILARRELPLQRVELSTTVSISKALEVESVVHTPRIFVKGASEQVVAAVKECSARAETMCLIAKAMRGNVQIEVRPEVVESPTSA